MLWPPSQCLTQEKTCEVSKHYCESLLMSEVSTEGVKGSQEHWEEFFMETREKLTSEFERILHQVMNETSFVLS